MNINFNKNLKKWLAYGLTFSIVLSGGGCGKKSDCHKPERHVHKYVNNLDNGDTLTAYFDSEKLKFHGFTWTEDSIDMTQVDSKFYKVLTDNLLFDAETNWDYLYHKMASNHDYLEFFWEYDEIVNYTTEDEDGNVHHHTKTEHHEGWSTNPRHSHNTGIVRVCHHRYVAFKIVEENGKFKKKKSYKADDIRDVSYEYPYVSEDCVVVVCSKNYRRRAHELPYLTVYDFDQFTAPRLDCKDYRNKKEDEIILSSSSEHVLSPSNNSHSFNTGFYNSFDSLTRKSNLNHYNTIVAGKTLKKKYH